MATDKSLLPITQPVGISDLCLRLYRNVQVESLTEAMETAENTMKQQHLALSIKMSHILIPLRTTG